MVKICQTGLLKFDFEIIPKNRIVRLLPKISAGHGWSWNFFCQFPNPWALRVSGMGCYTSKCEKSQNHCTQAAVIKLMYTTIRHARKAWPSTLESSGPLPSLCFQSMLTILFCAGLVFQYGRKDCDTAPYGGTQNLPSSNLDYTGSGILINKSKFYFYQSLIGRCDELLCQWVWIQLKSGGGSHGCSHLGRSQH